MTGTSVKNFDISKKDRMFALFAAALVLGTAVGTLFGTGDRVSGELKDKLFAVAGSFGSAVAGAGAAEYAAGTFLPMFLLMLAVFAGGSCAAALPIAFAAPFFRGLGFGFVCSCIYCREGAGAFMYLLCRVFPDMLFSGLLIAAASAEAAVFAEARARGESRAMLRGYCIRALFLFSAAAAAALAGAAISGAYIKGTHL